MPTPVTTPNQRGPRLGIALASVAATLGATSALAVAGSTAVRVVDEPYLGRLSNGAAVSYSLNRKVNAQTATIAGKRAAVKLIDRKRNLYSASVASTGLKQGRSYRVTVKATTQAGTRVLINERLYMHRDTSRPAAR